MSVKFPDILQHENPNYAILDINDIRGIYSLDSLDNLLEIPSDKRRKAGILSVAGGKLYVYKSVSTTDTDWSTPGNWREMGEGGGQQSGDYIQIYSSVQDLQTLKYGDCECVYCTATEQIYKYIDNQSGDYDTLNPPYVIQTGDASSTQYSGPRFVSLFYINGITMTAGKGIEIDYSENTISVEVDKPKNDSFLISPVWTISSTGNTDTHASISVENGDSVSLSATYKWIHNDSQKDPYSASGDLGNQLPASGIDSETYSRQNITSSTSFSETLTFSKKGLVVNTENQVVYAEGVDSLEKSISVTFKDKRYYGGSSLSPLDSESIKALSGSGLKTKGTESISPVTVDNNTYYYYCYPKSFGALREIYQNDVLPVLSGFTRFEANVTNDFGVQKAYYVYRSNKGAFTDKKLTFTF